MDITKRQASKELFIDTIVFAIGTVGAKVIMFFLLPIYTHYLSASELGAAELVVNFMNLLYPIATINILSSLLRYSMTNVNDKKEVLKSTFFIILIGCAITSVILYVINIKSSVQDWKHYLCILLFAYSMNQMLSVFAKSIGKTKICAIGGILYTVFLFIISVIFIVLFRRGTAGYLEGIIVANFLSICFYAIILKIHKYFSLKFVDWKLMKEMILFSIPLIINSISWWLTSFCDRFVLEMYSGTDSVGIYSVASKIPMLVSTVASIFMQAWVLSAIKEYEREEKTNLYDDVFEKFSSLFMCWAAVIICICKPLVSLIVSQTFFDSWVYVPLLLCGAVFNGFGTFFSALYTSAKKNVSVMLTTLSGAVVNIILNFILIPNYGIYGAVIATMISQLVVMIYRMIDSKRFIVINYSITKFILVTVILVLECVMSITIDSITLSTVCMLIVFALYNREIRGMSIATFNRLKGRMKVRK